MMTLFAVANKMGKKNFRRAICALSVVLMFGQVPVLAEGTGSYGAQPVTLEGSSVSNVSEKEILDILVPGGDDSARQVSPYSRETAKKAATKAATTTRKASAKSTSTSRRSSARKATVSSAAQRDKVRIAARESKRIDDVIKSIEENKSIAEKQEPAKTEAVKTEEKPVDERAAASTTPATEIKQEESAAKETSKKEEAQPKESRRARLLQKFKKLRARRGDKSTASSPESESLPANLSDATKEPEKDLKPTADATAASLEADKSTEASTAQQSTKDESSARADAKAESKEMQPSETASEKGARDGESIASKVPADVTDQAVESITAAAAESADGPVVIDNDEVVEQKESIEYTELPTVDGKTRIRIGARFPVVLSSQVTSKTAKKGDPIEGRLKYDLKIGGKLIAKKGSVVRGHLNYCLKARTILHSLVSPERWYRNSGCLGIDFDEIINERGEHIPCKAGPARMGRIVKNKAEGRELGVNHHGQITGPWAQQLRYKAIRVGLNFAMAPAGVFSFGAMPVALGVIGAANPNFAFSKPVGLNVRHRRLKGFAWGFLSGIPGSWLIEDTTVKGQEAIIKPGDEFLAEFKQEFTGEPDTDASLLSGASTNVKGQVVSSGKKSKKKK